jgi:2-iminobutanoate/2-iminopropanoate deaminase
MTTRTAIQTASAPAAIGPYSQAIRAGGLLFCSGQIALDPATGALVEGDVAAQTERVMANLRAVLEAAGADLSAVVKTTIYLADLGDFAEVNRIYGTFFAATPPARATIQVSALPLGARVEIEAIASVASE